MQYSLFFFCRFYVIFVFLSFYIVSFIYSGINFLYRMCFVLKYIVYVFNYYISIQSNSINLQRRCCQMSHLWVWKPRQTGVYLQCGLLFARLDVTFNVVAHGSPSVNRYLSGSSICSFNYTMAHTCDISHPVQTEFWPSDLLFFQCLRIFENYFFI